jgi:metal-responsive CopG/Arc/MetJ family transcriptional regulator
MKMKNDSTFVVRLPKEDLEKFNEILKKKAINRSELFRIWVRKYIEENEKNQ